MNSEVAIFKLPTSKLDQVVEYSSSKPTNRGKYKLVIKKEFQNLREDSLGWWLQVCTTIESQDYAIEASLVFIRVFNNCELLNKISLVVTTSVGEPWKKNWHEIECSGDEVINEELLAYF